MDGADWSDPVVIRLLLRKVKRYLKKAVRVQREVGSVLGRSILDTRSCFSWRIARKSSARRMLIWKPCEMILRNTLVCRASSGEAFFYVKGVSKPREHSLSTQTSVTSSSTRHEKDPILPL